MIRAWPIPSFALTGRTEAGRAVWRTTDKMIVVLDQDGRIAPLLTIPAGFETDGASVPRWARPWLDPWSRIGLPAVLHDWLLTRPDVPKWEADLLFLYALRSAGAPAFLATLLYFAVRLRRRPVVASAQSQPLKP